MELVWEVGSGPCLFLVGTSNVKGSGDCHAGKGESGVVELAAVKRGPRGMSAVAPSPPDDHRWKQDRG